MTRIIGIAICVAVFCLSAAFAWRGQGHRETRESPTGSSANATPTDGSIRSKSPVTETTLGGLVAAIDVSHRTAESEDESPRAQRHPHGKQVCASGCALSNHPTPRLSLARCRELLAEYAALPHDRESPSLNKLIFFGPQVANHLESLVGDPVLDDQHRAFLSRELSRQTVTLSIRVVDEADRVRVLLPPTKIPQHVRQVFRMDEFGLQPLVTSGTVKRVGLRQMWQRL